MKKIIMHAFTGCLKKRGHVGFKTHLEALNGLKSKSGRPQTPGLATVQNLILNRLITHFHNQQTTPKTPPSR